VTFVPANTARHVAAAREYLQEQYTQGRATGRRLTTPVHTQQLISGREDEISNVHALPPIPVEKLPHVQPTVPRYDRKIRQQRAAERAERGETDRGFRGLT
jgi:hypothetical protein